MVEVASLVLFARDLTASSAFYRAVGVPLIDEDHDEGPVHAAAELGGVHFAIYQADDGVGQPAPGWRSASSDFPGFYVDSLDDVGKSLNDLGTALLEDHQVRPWGCRIVAQDPDGRAVEISPIPSNRGGLARAGRVKQPQSTLGPSGWLPAPASSCAISTGTQRSGPSARPASPDRRGPRCRG